MAAQVPGPLWRLRRLVGLYHGPLNADVRRQAMSSAARMGAVPGWGRHGFALYVAGLLFPFILLEQSIWYPHVSIDSIPTFIAIGLLLAGPLVSAAAVATSNWSMPMTITWILLIPVILVVLFLVYWFAGSALLDRPFLPMD